jgi:hypothetical protein
MKRPYIGYVEISYKMQEKLITRRGLTCDDIRDACQAPNHYRRAAWHEHPEHGRRLIVFGQIRDGRLLKVILQPVDERDGTWRLRTALVATRGEGAR